jgi:16S rRNA processing protein RimM
MVRVGLIARTHGHRGHVILNADTDFPEERFAPGSGLYTWRDGTLETLTVAALRMHQGRPVVAFEGVDTMTDAERLAGLELRIPESSLMPLPDGSYYEHDLVGCMLVTAEGRELGLVRAVEGGGGVTRLVAGSGRGEIQVPLVDTICPVIDVAAKKIVVTPPEGLLDINA